MSAFKNIYVLRLLLCLGVVIYSARSFSAESLVLFHAGKRTYLDEDIRHKGISAQIWDQFILGKTNFDLPDYRKGLYGAEVFGDTSLYSTYELVAGQEPWVMVIKIKPNCTIYPRKYYTDYWISQINPKSVILFAQWLQHKLDHADLSLRQTITADVKDCSHNLLWDEPISYSMNKYSEEEQKMTLRCSAYLNDFLNETKIALVEDSSNGEDGSWYIRDRNCIENIAGTPDDLFRIIGQNRIGDKLTTLDQNFFGNLSEPSHFPAGSLYVFLRVLAETSLLNSKNIPLLDKIEKAMADSAYENYLIENQKIMQLFADQEFNFSTFSHSRLFVSTAVRAAKQSIKNNQVKDFQKQLAELLTQLRVHLGESCRGGKDGFQGVKAENEESCDQASLLYGQKIMSYFIGILQLK